MGVRVTFKSDLSDKIKKLTKAFKVPPADVTEFIANEWVGIMRKQASNGMGSDKQLRPGYSRGWARIRREKKRKTDRVYHSLTGQMLKSAKTIKQNTRKKTDITFTGGTSEKRYWAKLKTTTEAAKNRRSKRSAGTISNAEKVHYTNKRRPWLKLGKKSVQLIEKKLVKWVQRKVNKRLRD